MKLRIVSAVDGKTQVLTLSDDATFKDLREKIGDGELFLNRDSTPLVTDLHSRLASLGIKSMDTLTIKKAVAAKMESTSLKLKEIPDDNSCLFSAVAFVLREGDTVAQLRSLCAELILCDPEIYNAAILGQQPKAYAEWIKQPNSWGGAIELQILSKCFAVQIASIDVQTGRMDVFNPEADERVYLIYSGIHYDVIYEEPGRRTRFDASDVLTEALALSLAGDLKKNHRYTDLAGFTLRCNVCKKALIGQRDATQHATQTGHTEFIEYEQLSD